MSVSWNPWHGCRKISEGCRNCYVYRQDSRHDKDSREVRQTAMFDRPVRRSRDGRFKVPAGEMVYTCFTSDFLLEEADAWRAEAWEMMRIRHDLRFLFFTKRIDRLAAVLPPDWGDGYENVVIGCTVENQAMADYRLLLFLATPVRHRLIVCAPGDQNEKHVDPEQCPNDWPRLDNRCFRVRVHDEPSRNNRNQSVYQQRENLESHREAYLLLNPKLGKYFEFSLCL